MPEEPAMTDRERLPRVRLAAEAAKKIEHWLSIARKNPDAYPEWADVLVDQPLGRAYAPEEEA